MKSCSKRYFIVEKGEKVYCPDGTAHLVDEDVEFQVALLDEQSVRQTR
jgi:quercetin dioxygenase-like cupin family protein